MKNRRKFIQQSGALTLGLSMINSVPWTAVQGQFINGKDDVLQKLVEINDLSIEALIDRQINLPSDRWHGGLMNAYELPNAHSTYSFIVVLASSYACKFSKYYKSAKLEKPLERAIACLLNVQHEDGTIDLHSTNFHSTPDTGFLVNYLSPVYVCLKRMNQDGLISFISKLESFFINAGKCLLVGGIHTANHRWVVSAALARLNSFFPSYKYVERIEEWLAEGIDMDADGQYHERSVSVYSPVCNDMFITIGSLLDKPEILNFVRRNLEMSLYYIHPDGEVLTDASDRQDRAYTGYVDKYYYAYRYFSILDSNASFSAVCDLIEKKMPSRITNCILKLLEDPIFEKKLVYPSKIPDNYFKRFEHSGVFRIRRGNIDISIIENNPTFLSYRKGKAVLQSMRLAAAFFGRGQFEAEEVKFNGSQIILKKSITRGYYQVVPQAERKNEDAWKSYNRDRRELSEAQTLNYTVTITEESGQLTVEAIIEGTPHVPVSWELSFRKGGLVEGVDKDKTNADVYFLKKTAGLYQQELDKILFGSGAAPHKWAQLRGALPKQDGHSVYITGYTPFKHVIVLR